MVWSRDRITEGPELKGNLLELSQALGDGVAWIKSIVVLDEALMLKGQ